MQIGACHRFPAVFFELGDVLVLLTDGILEAESQEGDPFGSERVVEVIRRNSDRSAAEIIGALQMAIDEFCQYRKFSDDITSVAVKRLK